MTEEKKEEKEEMNYYRDLCKFTQEWFDKLNAEKRKVNMSEIIGGLEMMKQQFYISQTWFTSKVAQKALVDELQNIAGKLSNGKEVVITLAKDGSVMVRKDG
jgi:hypothetical protein